MKKLVVLILVLASNLVHAGSWSASTDVTYFYPHSTSNVDGTIYFKFSQMINPEACSNGHLIAMKKSNQLSSEILSILLTSMSVGKEVKYYVSGCDDNGYPSLKHISMFK